MAENEVLGDRRRALEEEYFHNREKELIEKMRLRAEEEAGRRQMAERTGIVDEEILADLQALGYTLETVMLLHFVPLVQMAWAEGGVSERERSLIREAARSRGVEDGSAAARQLDRWLSTRPSEHLFESTMRAINAMLAARPAEERAVAERDMLSYCSAIASASGGILGFGKVSDEEHRLLRHISEELERRTGTRSGATGDPDRTGQ
jgi:hypothetical protein